MPFVLREYRDGNERHQADIRFYDGLIAQRREKLWELTDKINSASLIYRRVEALLAAESKMLGVDVYRLDPVFFKKGY